MKISELARLAGCTTDTVRFYEKEGLLPLPERTDANYRSYDDSHVQRLRFIRNCRALDMSHDEIRKLLAAGDSPDADCAAVNGLIDEHLEHVVRRIEELDVLKNQLVALRGRCPAENAVQDCGIMQELGTMDAVSPAPSHSHV
ncbi:Cd(II)/Pb(II)-responsive transcriptional regulator [Paraburkholderia steynii]|uniref:Cd(II)/Pb(II)-responsive transcriptional regulator n=1 Tax=Paraburkholderia steynii TaxID=1245441 RepID=A0A4R0XB73_9BURK|nr:Cd(II)/Pb(II)-responsive transcriptional regulator [Paraburkholderia steynii]